MNSRRTPRVLVWLSFLACVVWGATWLMGAPAAERALAELDQHRLEAFFSKLAKTPPDIQSFVVHRRMAFPGVWYYEGQSHTASSAVSDHVHKSLVLWYGLGATVAWQDKEWFPGRSARVGHLAGTGY